MKSENNMRGGNNVEEEWLTLTEASQVYALANGSVIRMAISRGRIDPVDLRKIGPLWQIRRSTAERLWGLKEE